MSCSEIKQLKKMIQYKQQKRGGLAARAGKADDSTDCNDTIFFYDNANVSFDVDCCNDDIYGDCNDKYDGLSCEFNGLSDEFNGLSDDECEIKTCNSINNLPYRCKNNNNKCLPKHPLPWNKNCKDKCAIKTAIKKRINKEVSIDSYGRLNRIRMSLNLDSKRKCGKSSFHQDKTRNRIRSLIPAPRHMTKCCLDDNRCPVNSSSCPDLINCSCD